MRYLVLCLCFVATVFSACTKEESLEETKASGSFYIKFKVDGQQVEYNDNVLATKGMMNDIHTITVQGQEELTAVSPGIAVFIADSSAITPKIYTDTAITSLSALFYRDASATDYTSLYMTEPSEMKIEIIDINDLVIHGKFSGKASDLNDNIRTFSDGEFFVRFQ